MTPRSRHADQSATNGERCPEASDYGREMAARDLAVRRRPLTGDVTFVYTDIEKSTKLAKKVGDPGWRELQRVHHEVVRERLECEGGHEQSEQGDGFLFLFDNTVAAVRAALSVQQALVGTELGVQLKLRIGVHCGHVTALPRGGISGIATSQASRIADAPQGEQIVISPAVKRRLSGTQELSEAFKSQGSFWIDDIDEPVELFLWSSEDASGQQLRVRPVGTDGTPSYATPLIGRARDLIRLTAIVDAGQGRVVTLIGPGGVGKTRLAVELLEAHQGKTSFVDLASTTTTPALLTALLGTLGVRSDPDVDQVDLVVAELQVRPRLILLDNFEQALVAAPTLELIVDRCKASQFVVTSRVPLEIRAESTLEVLPLPTDEPSAAAMVLFAELSGHGYEAEFEHRDIQDLCQLLDGLPLALELAAARARTIGLENIREQLEQPMALLRRRRNGSENERHASMQAAIRWSYDLLAESEKQVLRSLSALDGASTVANLEVITGLQRLQLLDALDVLVHHRLATIKPSPTGPPRFSTLQLIRAFAREELETSAELPVVHEKIGELYVQLARRAEIGLISSDRVAIQAELDEELDNLRGVLLRSRSVRSSQRSALRIAASLVTYWWQGHLREGFEWLKELSHPTADVSPSLRSRGLIRAALLATSCGKADDAMSLLNEGVALARDSGERAKPTLSHGLQLLAAVQSARDEGEAALALAHEGLALDLDVDSGAQAVFRTNFADVLAAEGDDAAAERLFQESVDLFARSGDEWLRAAPLGRLGEIALRAGETKTALALFRESVEMWRSAGGRAGMPRSLAGLSRAIRSEDETVAAAVGRESFDLALELGAPGEAHWSFCSAALLLCVNGAEPQQVAELLGAALSIGRSYGQPIHPQIVRELQPVTIGLSNSLGSDDYARWTANGRRLDPPAAIDCGHRAWSDLAHLVP